MVFLERVFETDPSAHFDTNVDFLGQRVCELREIPLFTPYGSFELAVPHLNDVIMQ